MLLLEELKKILLCGLKGLSQFLKGLAVSFKSTKSGWVSIHAWMKADKYWWGPAASSHYPWCLEDTSSPGILHHVHWAPTLHQAGKINVNNVLSYLAGLIVSRERQTYELKSYNSRKVLWARWYEHQLCGAVTQPSLHWGQEVLLEADAKLRLKCTLANMLGTQALPADLVGSTYPNHFLTMWSWICYLVNFHFLDYKIRIVSTSEHCQRMKLQSLLRQSAQCLTGT